MAAPGRVATLASLPVLVLAAATTARAEAAIIVLPSVDPSTIAPQEGATIPTNASLWFWVSQRTDPGAVVVTQTLGEESRTLMQEVTCTTSMCLHRARFQDLPAGGSVRALITSPAADVEMGWRIGNDADAQPPSFSDGAAEIASATFGSYVQALGLFESNPGYRVVVAAPVATDDFAVTAYTLRRSGESDAEWFGSVPLLDTVQLEAFLPGDEERTECFIVGALDVAGNETLLDGEACVDLAPEGPRGAFVCRCVTTSRNASVVGVALCALLALLTRRRAGPSSRGAAGSHREAVR